MMMNEKGEFVIPKEKQLDGTRMEVGVCRFCGQARQLEVSGPWTEEMLDRAATDQCDCEGAQIERRRTRTLKGCERKIDVLFEDLEEKERETMKELCAYIYDEKMEKVTLAISKKVKAVISRNSKGNMRIERTEKTTKAGEVE